MTLEQRQYRCHTAKGPKYWKYELEPDSGLLRTYTGKNPARWKPRERQFDDPMEARRYLEKTRRKKLREGFAFVREWDDAAHGDVVFYTNAPDNSTSDALDLHPAGHTLALGTTKRDAMGAALYLFDIHTCERTCILEIEPEGGRQTFLHSVHFNPTGDALIYTVNGTTYRRVLQSGETEQLASYEEFRSAHFNPHVLQPQQDHSRQRMLLYDRDDTVKIRHESGEVLFSLRVGSRTAECRSGALSHDGSWLVLYIVSRHIVYGHDDARGDQTNRVEIWDVDNNTHLHTICFRDKLDTIGISPDKSFLVLNREFAQGPGFFAIPSGQKLYHHEETYRRDRWGVCYHWAFAPQDAYLFFGARGPACLHIPTKTLTYPEGQSYQRTYRLFFSQDGRMSCVGGDQGDIVLRKWDPPPHAQEHLPEHTQQEEEETPPPTREALLQVATSVIQDPRLLHYFAADCAQRALAHAEKMGRPTAEASHEAIATKHRWLLEQCDDETLKGAQKAARIAIPSETPFDPPADEALSTHAAARAAFWAAYTDDSEEQGAHIAAENASREALRTLEKEQQAAEQGWQLRRLQWWQEIHEHTERLWLATTSESPLPPPTDATLDWPLP